MRLPNNTRVAVALLTLLLPGVVLALPPWSELLDTWHASQQAMGAGYPKKIEIRPFGKSSVDGKACRWEEEERTQTNSIFKHKETYTQLRVRCHGYEPFTIKIGGMLYKSGNTVLVDFNRSEEVDCSWQFPPAIVDMRKNMRMPCFRTLYETYFNDAGINEARAKARAAQEKRSLKQWGN